MLSTIRSALTPGANQAEDTDLSMMPSDSSLAAPSLPIRDSTPPPFSPFESSQPEAVWARQASNGNGPMMAEQHDYPMDLSSDRDSPDREQEATDDSLLGPVKASDPVTKSHYDSFSLDGASNDHLHVPEDDTQPQDSPLPSTEPAQFTSKPQRDPTPVINHAGLNQRTSITPQPAKMPTKTKGKASAPQIADRATSKSGAASVEPEQSAPPVADDTNASTSSKAPLPKRKRDDDPTETETKHVKKQRGQRKKEEHSTATVNQQDAPTDEPSKKRGRPKKEEGSTHTIKQKNATEDESPKKRGRPKKEQGSVQQVKSQRASKEDAAVKRGSSKQVSAPTKYHTSPHSIRKRDSDGRTKGAAAPVNQGEKTRETPKKRGRPAKEAEPAGAVEPTDVTTADTPKKRGRPKKEEEAEQGTEPVVAFTADTPKKRGKPKKKEDIAEATVPQGSSHVETPKKRGRPKAAEQDAHVETPTQRGRPKAAEQDAHVETPKKRGRPKAAEQDDAPKPESSGKRGRPKKEQATTKGAKPVGIVKKKAGKK